MENYELKQIKVLGYTTDFNMCDCCGKENLKGTINILDIDNNVILHFGTTCAIKANKYDNLDALQLAKKETSKAIRNLKIIEKNAYLGAWRKNIDVNTTTVINDYIAFELNIENKLKRFNWESYK